MNTLPSNQQTLESQSTSISIEIAESSIQHLTTTFNRRERWTEFYNPRKQSNLLQTSPWRSHLGQFFESNVAHLITIFLLALDLIICVIELSLSEVACQSKQEAHEPWYHWVGVAILALLATKSVVHALAVGSAFFRRCGDVVDAVAVAAALVMEVGLEKFGGGLIMVVSLWRIIRVVESAFELGDGEIEGQIEGILVQFEGIKVMNDGLARDLEEKDNVILRLQEELELERTPYGTPL